MDVSCVGCEYWSSCIFVSFMKQVLHLKMSSQVKDHWLAGVVALIWGL